MRAEDLERSVGDATYRRIRQEIVFGTLPPREKLKLVAMGKQYETSVSTLRELLSRLAAEGLVAAEGQRGFEVAHVSAEELRELAQMRLLLECHALRLSFSAGDLEWEGRFVAAHHKLSRLEKRLMASERADILAWKRYDWEFHHALISACGSSELLQVHADVYDKYLRYQMVVGIFRGSIVADEHRALMNFALDRNIEGAVATLREHVDACVDAIIALGVLP